MYVCVYTGWTKNRYTVYYILYTYFWPTLCVCVCVCVYIYIYIYMYKSTDKLLRTETPNVMDPAS